MRYQEYMCQAIQNAADEVFRYAKAVPEDKVEWKPLESGRSVLDMAREIAKSPDWAREVISSLESPQWSEEKAAAQKQEMEQWKTVAQ
ncbi:MAG TPA: hypothetical protein VKT78_15405, partial [Fimbriimonadaceae bacterium]|nr:hypothetical protein [Fimbriimonadaceae bacterium]